MKKFFLIVFIIFLIGIVWKVFFTPCKLEKTKVHQIARPIVKALAEHIDTYGVPESLDDVKGVKHNFEYKNEKYSLGGYLLTKYTYIFSIVHNDTRCDYQFSLINNNDKKELNPMKNYSYPRCGTTCKTWWRM